MSQATQQQVAAPAGAPGDVDKPNIMMALLQAPSVIVLFLWMIVPLLLTIYFSFIRYSLVNPDVKGFAGFENYQFLIEDESSPAPYQDLPGLSPYPRNAIGIEMSNQPTCVYGKNLADQYTLNGVAFVKVIRSSWSSAITA